jgi:hypothetical protein
MVRWTAAVNNHRLKPVASDYGSKPDRSAKLAVRLRSAPPTIQIGGEATHALTFNLDQSLGADQNPMPANLENSSGAGGRYPSR